MKGLLLNVESAQAALFINPLILTDRLKSAELIKNKFGSVFDGIPTILPIPDDAPFEIPRIILNSKSKSYSCNISINRVDLIYKSISSKEYSSYKDFVGEFTKLIDVLVNSTINLLSGHIYRLGLVVNYSVDPRINGYDFLKSKFLTKLVPSGIALQIHTKSEGKINEFAVNNWLRFVTKEKTTNNSSLLIISDINTSQKHRYNIDAKKTILFFYEALKLSIKSLEGLLNI